MRRYSLFILLGCWANLCIAQHDMSNMHHGEPPGKEHKSKPDTTAMKMAPKDMHMAGMSSAQSLQLPMNRNGSGTGWLPDITPMYGFMKHSNKWMLMAHGDVFIRYNAQDIRNAGSRGGAKWDAPNMIMGMAQRNAGRKGLLHFNVMLSADALIAGGAGYPLLFQTGESWEGKPLVDRQHPHDLFSELSASYAFALSPMADISVYAGYPGEPALGPVTFMHRPSGQFMPDAPIGHHWEDATHISFGVATLGFRYGKVKLEGSSFTGREPDEQRFNFDKPRFDSWSGRLSFNPSENWALQVSRGYIKSPEALHATDNLVRTTASATYVYPFAKGKYIAATALWGQNDISGQAMSNAVLGEATLKIKKWATYVRYEWVQKSAEELDLNPLRYDIHKQWPVNSLTAGAGYDLCKLAGITIAAGAQISVSQANARLRELYGNMPVSGEVYLHLYPKLM